jgi:hypothetical protein
MTSNVGYGDRAVRQTAGIMMLALALSGTVAGATGAVLLVLGSALVVSGTVGVCLLYRAFGWSTAPRSA